MRSTLGAHTRDLVQRRLLGKRIFIRVNALTGEVAPFDREPRLLASRGRVNFLDIIDDTLSHGGRG